MTALNYQCTSCELTFEGIPSMAAHIQHEHEPAALEDELELMRRRALNVPDEDEDDDDDDAEDELFPTSPGPIVERVEYLRKTAALFIAERNHRGLENVFAELDGLECHLRIIAEGIVRSADDARACLRTVEWVLRSDAAVIP